MGEKLPTLTSPIVPWNWPWINVKKTKFNPEGEYTVDMVFDSEDHPFLKKVEGIMEDAYQGAIDAALESKQLKPAKVKDVKTIVPWKAEEDADGNETGRIIWPVKTKAVVKAKKTGKNVDITVKVFDANLKDITSQKVKVGSGTKGRVSFSYKVMFVKITGNVHMVSYLNAVQIVELAEFGNSDGGAFGFGAEEGFSGADYVEPETKESSEEEEAVVGVNPDDDAAF